MHHRSGSKSACTYHEGKVQGKIMWTSADGQVAVEAKSLREDPPRWYKYVAVSNEQPKNHNENNGNKPPLSEQDHSSGGIPWISMLLGYSFLHIGWLTYRHVQNSNLDSPVIDFFRRL